MYCSALLSKILFRSVIKFIYLVSLYLKQSNTIFPLCQTVSSINYLTFSLVVLSHQSPFIDIIFYQFISTFSTCDLYFLMMLNVLDHTYLMCIAHLLFQVLKTGNKIKKLLNNKFNFMSTRFFTNYQFWTISLKSLAFQLIIIK